MRKMLIYKFMLITVFFGTINTMDSALEGCEQDDRVDQCIDDLIVVLPKARTIMNGMKESNTLKVRSIAQFYDVATSTWRYRGLYGAELLVGTAYNEESSLAPAAKIVYALARNVPIVGDQLARLEPTNNNNNSDSLSHPSVTPVSNAAYQLRNLNLNKMVIDAMSNHESEVDEWLKDAQLFLEANGEDIVSFLQNNKKDISSALRILYNLSKEYGPATMQCAKENRVEIAQTIKTVSDACKEHGDVVVDYLKEHSQEIKQYAVGVKKCMPAFMAGVKAAYAYDRESRYRAHCGDKSMSWWCG